MKYYKNKIIDVDFDEKEKIITIKTNDKHFDSAIGSKDTDYVTYVIKSTMHSKEFIPTIVKISCNRFYNFYFEKFKLVMHVHDVENVIISNSGIIID